MNSNRRPRHEGVWEEISDVESRMAAEAFSVVRAEASELLQAEEQGVELVGRLQASTGGEISLRLVGSVEYIAMEVSAVGATWVAGRTARGQSLIPLGQIEAARGLTARTQPLGGSLSSSLSLRSRIRAMGGVGPIGLETVGAAYRGRVKAVGADWVELDAHGECVLVRLDQVRRVDRISG
ncbi:MAG: hypothetical protein ACTHW1_11190 [Ancrocorticia sp.]|uniref:hypothetical protein n=1 Tax=Ancrocorticia sp. TaxID=2593684 RepID=UPI003F902B3E